MPAKQRSKSQHSAFRDQQAGAAALDGDTFLLDVDARFNSDTIRREVRWRLDVLRTLAEQHDLREEYDILRNQFTRIFSQEGTEEAILDELAALTFVERADGTRVDLRRFLVREPQVHNEHDYRGVLARKNANTLDHVVTLTAFYPQEEPTLRHLSVQLSGLAQKIADAKVSTANLKRMADRIRATVNFQAYETLKTQCLKDWLRRHAGLSEQRLAQLDPGEIEALIREHQRHQMGQLVSTRMHLLETDVSEHLGLHETLEAEFRDETFWQGANAAVRRGFRELVLHVVQQFGMPRERRYAMFQSDADKSQYLLIGLGVAQLPTSDQEPITLIPYMKPFTRRSGYLLEIRRRAITDEEAYHNELVHYTLPFLVALDQLPYISVNGELRTFFNNKYN